ncbi:MAG: hypothetical protein ABR576_14610 [Thermoanaerobaculia bacterium]
MMRFLRRAEEKNAEMEAGPALDREIERQVLGVEPAGEVPRYSTQDATAVALATRFSRERGWWHFEKREVYGGWSVGWIEESQPLLVSIQPIRASGPTRALAICRSLLKVARDLHSRPDGGARRLDRPAPLRL